MIFNCIVDIIFDDYGYFFRNLVQLWLFQVELKQFVDFIYVKGVFLEICWGFIDGMVWLFCKLGQNQWVFYNGYKRVYLIKFQFVVVFNGLIVNLYGFVEGKWYDSGLFVDFGLFNDLLCYFFVLDGIFLCIYGDLVYFLWVYLQGFFKGVVLIFLEQYFNKFMS